MKNFLKGEIEIEKTLIAPKNKYTEAYLEAARKGKGLAKKYFGEGK